MCQEAAFEPGSRIDDRRWKRNSQRRAANAASSQAARPARQSLEPETTIPEPFNCGGIVETVLQDLRFAFRMLRKSRGFTLVAVSKASGIGRSTARHLQTGDRAWRRVGTHRSKPRSDGRAGIDAIPVGCALRRQSARSRHICSNFGVACQCRAARLLFAGASRDESGPDGRVAIRVVGSGFGVPGSGFNPEP